MKHLVLTFFAAFFLNATEARAIMATGLVRSCQDIFSESSKPSWASLMEASRLATKKTFDSTSFDKEVATYEALAKSGSEIPAPTSIEGKLALFEVSAKIKGHSILKLEEWIRTTPPETVREVLKPLLKSKKGLRPAQIEKLFVRLYLLTHSDPKSFRQVMTQPISDTLQSMIVQRLEKEVGTKSVARAFESMGLLRSAGLLDRALTVDGRYPPAVQLAFSSGVDVVGLYFLGVISPTTRYSALGSKPLPDSLRERIEKEGFDGIRPHLQVRYGRSAKFDLAFHWGRRVAFSALMAYALEQVTETSLRTLLPPESQNEEDGLITLTGEVITYWSGFFGYPIDLSSKVDRKATEADINQLIEEVDSLEFN